MSEKIIGETMDESRQNAPVIASASAKERQLRAFSACEGSANAKNHAIITKAFFVH